MADIVLNLYSLKYDPGSLSVAWVDPSPDPGSVTYDVNLTQPSGTTVHTTSAQQIDIPVTLDTPADAVTVLVTRMVSGTKTGESATFTVIHTAPALSLVQYDLEPAPCVSVDWAAAPNVTAPTYIATLSATGGATENAQTTELMVGIDATLDAEESYSVTVRASTNGGIVIGPASQALTPIVGQPQIAKLQYDDKISSTWAAVDGAEAYVATLSKTGSATQNQTTDTPSIDWDVQLPPDSGYTFAVRGANASGTVLGPASAALTPLTAAPVAHKIQYDLDPAPTLEVTWDALTGVSDYAATLSQTGGTTRNETSSTTSVSFDGTLDPSKSFQVSIRAISNGGIVVGPSSALYAPIVGQSTVAALSYQIDPTSVVSATWNAITGVTEYVATLSQLGGQTRNQTVDVLTAQFDGALTGTASHVFTVRGSSDGGIVLGPASTAYSLITQAPAVTALTYAEAPTAELTGTWTAIDNAEVTQYAAKLTTAAGPSIKTVSDLTVAFPGALTTADAATFTVMGMDASGVVTGPGSSVLSAIVTSPHITGLVYDISPTEALTCTWDALSTPPGATYTAALIPSSGTPTSKSTPTTTVTFDGALDDSLSYDVTLSASDANGVVQGPSSAPLAVVTASSAVTSLAYDDGVHLVIGWADFPASVTGAEITLSDGTTFDAAAQAPATVVADILGKSIDVQVRGTVGDISKGPLGTALQAITIAPVTTGLVWNGTHFTLSWADIDDQGVTGYTVSIAQNGGTPTTHAATQSPFVIPDLTLTPETAYTGRVQATKPSVQGPIGPEVYGPFQSQVVYASDTQGRLIRETWGDPTKSRTAITYTMDPAGNITAVTPSTVAAPATRG